MICPKCHDRETQVIDSRDGPDSVRRRRECLSCKYRFTTYERTETPQVTVIKKGGDRQRFDPEKVRAGVRTSCKNRPVTSSQIDTLVDEVSERACCKEEITSQEIGQLVQERLQELDPVAYLRFTSVYQEFANMSQFEAEIQSINE